MSKQVGDDDDDDDNEDIVEDEYDDDEEDEDDFNPGFDDGDEDDDEDYDDELVENGVVSLLDGVLSYDEGQKIHYKGNGFHLESVETVSHNVLDRNDKPPTGNTITVEVIGPCDVSNGEGSGKKPTPRKIQLTISVADPNHAVPKSTLKGDPDPDDDDEEKKPSLYYHVYGREINNPDYGIEFKGGYIPLPGGKEIKLLCHVRTAESAKNSTTTPNATASAAAVGKRRKDNDEEIDDVDEDEIDNNELIALHEEAMLPFEALRKRYRNGGEQKLDDPNGDEHVDTAKKKIFDGQTKYKNDKKDDDDDDDDIEF
jgi:hypothetical protein